MLLRLVGIWASIRHYLVCAAILFGPKTEVLIKWRGAPVEDSKWENVWRLPKTYPDFILADKDS